MVGSRLPVSASVKLTNTKKSQSKSRCLFSQVHRMPQLGRDLKDHLALTPLLWARHPLDEAGPHPNWH